MKIVVNIGMIALVIGILATIGQGLLVFANRANASDKQFGELLGTIGHDKIYRFETPSAVCFTYSVAISCVANK